MELFVDLQGEDKVVKITDGNKLPGVPANTYTTEYVDITINNLQRYPCYIQSIGSNKLVLDITIKDKKDEYASTGIPDIFLLENLDYEGEGVFSMGIGGTPQVSKTIGPISVSFDKSGLGVSEDVLGFVNGYKTGVEYCFNQ